MAVIVVTVIGLIGGTAVISGTAEAVAAALISTPIIAALGKVMHKEKR